MRCATAPRPATLGLRTSGEGSATRARPAEHRSRPRRLGRRSCWSDVIGNTLDRWYRRAAIVVWPRRWAFAVRAQASPGWALDRLADLVRAGDVAGARDAAATLASFWSVAAKA